MKGYTVIYSTITGASALHARDCKCTKGLKGTGLVSSYVRGLSPASAAYTWRQQEEAETRGLKKTTIAKCAQAGPESVTKLFRAAGL